MLADVLFVYQSWLHFTLKHHFRPHGGNISQNVAASQNHQDPLCEESDLFPLPTPGPGHSPDPRRVIIIIPDLREAPGCQSASPGILFLHSQPV